MKKLATTFDRINHAITGIGAVILVVNVLLVVANIILRRVFNSPIYGSTEYVQYISLVVGALGLCQNEWFDGNVTMTIVLELLPKKAAEVMRFICGIISSVGFAYVSYLMVNDVFNKFAKNDVTNMLKMPRWIFVAVLAFGIIMLTVSIIVKTIIQGYAVATGREFNVKDLGTFDEPGLT